MPNVAVRIPKVGEDLREARLVECLKKPGDQVKLEEPLYTMETDKMLTEIPSPYEGVLSEWLAEPDTVLPVGAPVAMMEVAEGVEEMVVHGEEASATPAPTPTLAPRADGPARAAGIPPRTRAYAKEKGVSDEDLAQLAAKGGKLMPADVDAFLADRSFAPPVDGGYTEHPQDPKQRLLASRLVRGTQLVVPGTMSVVAKWEPIEAYRAAQKASGGDFQPSAFTIFAYAVVRALKDHPAFRSQLRGEDTLRTYDHVALGIAVALPGDHLVLAVVEDADTLGWQDFAAKTRERIDLARTGVDQATEAVTLSLTNMQSFGLRDAVPVVVTPAVGTLFLGEVYRTLDPSSEEPKTQRVVNLALTFDHRIVNGVGGAEFLNAVKRNLETVGEWLGA